MSFSLNKPFAADRAVEESDVRVMKNTLNRLGYYTPYEKTGMTDIPDAEIFGAIKAFQKDNGLTSTGVVKPDDETASALAQAARDQVSGRYIWRTVGDDQVRDAHAALNGSGRDFADSPAPGDEFNCRCWADFKGLKLERLQEEGLTQELISEVHDANRKWTNEDFVLHFFIGGGKEKTLEKIGILGEVINHARKIMFDNVLLQVIDRARNAQTGVFTGSWSNSYPFGEVVFSLGGVTIKGRFGGKVKKEGEMLVIDARAEYEFSDTFTDPLNKREKKIGSSAIEDIPYDFSKPWWNPGNIAAGYLASDTEYFGTPYEIIGKWTTKIEGSISLEDE